MLLKRDYFTERRRKFSSKKLFDSVRKRFSLLYTLAIFFIIYIGDIFYYIHWRYFLLYTLAIFFIIYTGDIFYYIHWRYFLLYTLAIFFIIYTGDIFYQKSIAVLIYLPRKEGPATTQ